jgi:uncharacterized tellurite resistance protein B-like protein
MGLFDMFKSEAPKLDARLALAVGLLYMMSADGEIGQEEIGQLRSVVGNDDALLGTAIKYLKAGSIDRYLADAPAVMTQEQKLCLLINACDSLLADGAAAASEQQLFYRMLTAMGVSEADFQPYMATIALKNNKQLFA